MAKRGLDELFQAIAEELRDAVGDIGDGLRAPGRRGGRSLDDDDEGFRAVERMQAFYAGLAGREPRFRTAPDAAEGLARLRREAEQVRGEFEQLLQAMIASQGSGTVRRLKQLRPWLEEELQAVARRVSNAFHAEGTGIPAAAAAAPSPAARATAALDEALRAVNERFLAQRDRLLAEAGEDRPEQDEAFDRFEREYRMKLALLNRRLDPPVDLPADAFRRYCQGRAEGRARAAAAADEAGQHLRFRLRQFARDVAARIAAEREEGAPAPPPPPQPLFLEDAAGPPAPHVRLVAPIPFAAFERDWLRDAVALVRPYPPRRGPARRSHLGGLPDLPPGTDWPRAADGVPLHFLAQVDLAEMPWLLEEMPERGTLLFFAAMGRDSCAPDEAGGTRVLFDAGSDGRPAQPPADLPARKAAGEVDRMLAEADGAAPRLYRYWPLEGLHIRSLPDPHAFDDNAGTLADYAEYCRVFPEWKAAEIRRAAGLPAAADRPGPLPVFAAPEAGRPARLLPYDRTGFPWTGRGYALVAGTLLRGGRWRGSESERDELESWLRKGEAAPGDRVKPAEAERFTALLNAHLAREKPQHRPGFVPRLEADPVEACIALAVRALVADSAAAPALAAAIPDEVYAAARPEHSILNHHQMFGYVGAAQIPLRAASPTVTLLQLVSGRGAGMVFGDSGELDFRIAPEALAARAWHRVEAATTSH